MWDWLLLVLGLLTGLYWYLTQHYNWWSSKGVYTPPGVFPGVGHFWDAFVLKKGVAWLSIEFYHKTKNHPAVGLYEFRQPSLLIRDLDLVQKVLISEFSNFHDNSAQVDPNIEPHISKNPFLLKGAEWKAMRQQLAPAFSPAKIKAMFPLVKKVCDEFNMYMDKHLNENTHLNQVTGLFTSEVVAKCAFGLDGRAFTDPDAEFYKQGRKLWDGSLLNPMFMMILFYFPQINNYILRKSIAPKEVTEFFITLVKQAWDFREQHPDQAPDNDYLQFLFNIRKKNPEYTIDDVVAQCLTFFTDGFESSSMAASFALFELTVNPELQEEVRKEVKSMESFTYENVTSLPLLDRVFHETVRKYCVFAVTKVCTNDTVLEAKGNTYPVSKGMNVVIPVFAIHHDPDIYPVPEKFDPDRFLPENVKSRHPTSFLSFASGPRTCIGYRFATSTVKILLANILTNFRLVKCDKTVEKIDLNPLHLMPVVDDGLYVGFQKV